MKKFLKNLFVGLFFLGLMLINDPAKAEAEAVLPLGYVETYETIQGGYGITFHSFTGNASYSCPDKGFDQLVVVVEGKNVFGTTLGKERQGIRGIIERLAGQIVRFGRTERTIIIVMD
jgi:hypothetical protein